MGLSDEVTGVEKMSCFVMFQVDMNEKITDIVLAAEGVRTQAALQVGHLHLPVPGRGGS